MPGHAFRAGDKIRNIVNRQISDGVIGYWEKGSLSPDERVQLRRFTKRELAEDWDVATRKEDTFKISIDWYERQAWMVPISHGR